MISAIYCDSRNVHTLIYNKMPYNTECVYVYGAALD